MPRLKARVFSSKFYNVPTPTGEIATSPTEAARIADTLDDDVVMKLVSPEIVHKTDIGGVRIGVEADAVGSTYRELIELASEHDPGAEIIGVLVQELVEVDDGVETIVGTSHDPQFGPVVMFGLGGIFVETLQDVAFRVAPLGANAARTMIEELHAAPKLRGARGRRPADIDAIVEILQRISQLATSFPTIRELDINPLVVGSDGVIALDFRATIETADD